MLSSGAREHAGPAALIVRLETRIVTDHIIEQGWRKPTGGEMLCTRHFPLVVPVCVLHIMRRCASVAGDDIDITCELAHRWLQGNMSNGGPPRK